MRKSELLRMVEQLSIDPIWNCYTRAALELRWNEFSQDAVGIAYCDIDDMHGLNEQYGHDGTDQRILKVIESIRHDDIVSSRWLNGDELVFILKSGDVKSFCIRLLAEFNGQGINATFSYSTWVLADARETISPLDAKVQRSKNHNVRGVILD